MYTVQVENWELTLPQLLLLFPYHWRELAVYQAEMPMDMAIDRYSALSRANALMLVTIRYGRELVGYYLMFVLPHYHYAGSGLWGVADMYFITPEHRNGAGFKLFKFIEVEARRRGIKHLVTSCKVHEDHTEFLTALGWKWTDKTFQKSLR